MKINADGYVKCDICEAPHRKPLTNGWTMIVSQVGTKTYLTPHRPNCPAGGETREQASA